MFERPTNRIQQDLRSLNTFAWLTAAVWMAIGILALESLVSAAALLMLVPAAIMLLGLGRMLLEPIVNYGAHVPPHDGDEADTLEPAPRWAIVGFVTGSIAFLWAASVLAPETLETTLEMLGMYDSADQLGAET